MPFLCRCKIVGFLALKTSSSACSCVEELEKIGGGGGGDRSGGDGEGRREGGEEEGK